MTDLVSDDAVRVGYLTSQYPATSHTFIRREVAALRGQGMVLDTFSVRAPAQAELKAQTDRDEAASTFTILRQPLGRFVGAHISEFARAPGRYLCNAWFALRHRAPGVRNGLLALAHFAESIVLASELRRRGIDHLHNHFANSAATVGLLAARQVGIGWSFTIHGVSEFDYPAGLTLAAKIESAAFVACVSYFGRAQAERLTDPMVWPKLEIVRCGLELDQLPQPEVSSTPPGALNLVAVGRLSAENGFAGLLDALASLGEASGVHLRLVGDGPLRAELEAQAARLGLEQKVAFLGRLPEAETLAAIAASDTLVLSSFMEGLPIVLMEALALGKPVIASRVAGIPELVRDGETGLLFSPSKWDELAAAIRTLATDPALRRRMGTEGPRVIAREFDVQQSARVLRSLFREHARSGSIRPVRPS